MYGAHTAALQYQHAPVFMQKSAPKGVAGKDAMAKGAVVPAGQAEGLMPIWNVKEPYHQAGQAVNYPVLRDWFLPRYRAWKADPSKVVTVAEVAAIMGAKSTWLPATPPPSRSEPVVTLERGTS